MLNYLSSLIYAKLFGQYVGSDIYNNQYYVITRTGQQKRWVIYNGIYDPSKIPVEWHRWLHFNQALIPINYSQKWIPNVTGTHFIQNSITSIENIPQSALRCYENWSPDR